MVTLDLVNQVIGLELPDIHYTYTERDVSLYALGVGAPANWLDPQELRFVYERSRYGFQVLPSFAVIYSSAMIDTLLSGNIGGIEYNPMMLVHGEQYLELKKPLPLKGTITCKQHISDIVDKRAGMVIITDVNCYDEQGDHLAFTQSSMFIRGLGGFGGNRGEKQQKVAIPQREPDAALEEKTLEKQALIYRLSGDINPLHADPEMAARGNFDTPILHGLSTFGFAVRAILKHFCDNDPSRFKSVRVRFSNPVFPGDTLRTEMWDVGEGQIIFQTRVPDRNDIVLSNATAEVAT